MVPMNSKDLYIEWIKQLDLSVILVVGNRVGAINHSLLTVAALKSYGIRCLGLIFNQVDPTVNEIVLADNQDIISGFTELPVLGSFRYDQDVSDFDWEPCVSVCRS